LAEDEQTGGGFFRDYLSGHADRIFAQAFPQLSPMLKAFESHLESQKAATKATENATSTNDKNSSKYADVLVEAIQDSIDIVHNDLKMTNIILSSSLTEQTRMARALDKIATGGMGGGGNGASFNSPDNITNKLSSLWGLLPVAIATAVDAGLETITEKLMNKVAPSTVNTSGNQNEYEANIMAKALQTTEWDKRKAENRQQYGVMGGTVENALEFFGLDHHKEKNQAQSSLFRSGYKGNDLEDEQKREVNRGDQLALLNKINTNLDKLNDTAEETKDANKLAVVTGEKTAAALAGGAAVASSAASIASTGQVPIGVGGGNNLLPPMMQADADRRARGFRNAVPAGTMPNGGGGGGGNGMNLPTISGSDGAGRKSAEDYLGRKMSDDEYSQLVRATGAESTSNPREQAMVMASILNRGRDHPGGVIGALHEANQFQSVTGTAADNHSPSANFLRGPDAGRLSSIESSAASYLSHIPQNQKNFTAASSAAYGPGTNIGYRDQMLANGGMRIGGTIFNSSFNDDSGNPTNGTKNALLAAGTNDWSSKEAAEKGVAESIENLKKKGYDPVVVLPNKDIHGSSAAYEGAMAAAKAAGVRTEYPSGFGEGSDNIHMSGRAAAEIRAKYPGAYVTGDSNSIRLGAKEGISGFTGKGSGFIASQIENAPQHGGPLQSGGGPKGVVDMLDSMKQKGWVTNEQCVSLATASVGIRLGDGQLGSNVHDWRRGESASAGNLMAGQPIATFLDRQGHQSDRYAGGGSGTPGAHLDHAGVFQSYIKDDKGNNIGMNISEQYQGSGGIHTKRYMFNQGWGEGNASSYSAVRTSDGRLLGDTRNPGMLSPDRMRYALSNPYDQNNADSEHGTKYYSNAVRDVGIQARARDMNNAANIQQRQNTIAAALHKSSAEEALTMRKSSIPPLVQQFNQKTDKSEGFVGDHGRHNKRDTGPVAPPDQRLDKLFTLTNKSNLI
jgi:hypothetical protein